MWPRSERVVESLGVGGGLGPRAPESGSEGSARPGPWAAGWGRAGPASAPRSPREGFGLLPLASYRLTQEERRVLPPTRPGRGATLYTSPWWGRDARTHPLGTLPDASLTPDRPGTHTPTQPSPARSNLLPNDRYRERKQRRSPDPRLANAPWPLG